MCMHVCMCTCDEGGLWEMGQITEDLQRQEEPRLIRGAGSSFFIRRMS